MARIRPNSQSMDQRQRYTKMILFLLVGSCHCWLSDYFNTTGEQHKYYAKDVVDHLKSCVENIDVVEWELRVRNRTVNEKTCSEVEKISKCVNVTYQDARGEYLRLLVEDAKFLCKTDLKKEEKESPLKMCIYKIGLFLLFLDVFLTTTYYFIVVRKVLFMKKKTNKNHSCSV